MAKIFFELIGGVIVFLILSTQIIIPLFSNNIPFFWIFKKNIQKNSSGINSLDELAKETDESVEKMESTKQKISSAEQTLNQIKSKTQ